MKVAMFSNYLNHHQLPFCKAMVELTGGEFVFVASTPVNPARLAIGYSDMNSAYPFVVRSYESEAQYREAQKLALDCDVMIHGSAPEEFIDARLRKRPDAVTFRYSERLFKESAGKVNRLSPFFWASCVGNLLRRRPNYYLLAASAYAPIDYYHIGFGKGKYLKWGYFPKSAEQSLELIAHKKASRLRIVWVGRIIGWKHPEHALYLAKRLQQEHIDFEMFLIGEGELREELEKEIREANLQDSVVCTGGLSNDQVHAEMAKSHIHLFTSDWNEGWGAVLNEAMANACVPVASRAIGAAPFLIKDGNSGFTYATGDPEDLCAKVKLLANDPLLLKEMAAEAYHSINTEWSAQTAARRLCSIAEGLAAGKAVATMFENGPCSPAPLLEDNWR